MRQLGMAPALAIRGVGGARAAFGRSICLGANEPMIARVCACCRGKRISFFVSIHLPRVAGSSYCSPRSTTRSVDVWTGTGTGRAPARLRVTERLTLVTRRAIDATRSHAQRVVRRNAVAQCGSQGLSVEPRVETTQRGHEQIHRRARVCAAKVISSPPCVHRPQTSWAGRGACIALWMRPSVRVRTTTSACGSAGCCCFARCAAAEPRPYN